MVKRKGREVCGGSWPAVAGNGWLGGGSRRGRERVLVGSSPIGSVAPL
jgi:hypothetical protein